MKIALIQLDVHDKLWSIDNIGILMTMAKGADLVVFPECMPFDKAPETNPISLEAAIAKFEYLGTAFGKTAFIAGGYVSDNEEFRNVVFLVHKGRVKDKYFKQVVWEGENHS